MNRPDIAIKIENLRKCYHVYDKPRDRLLQMLSFGRKKYYREFWALRDVSFEVKQGETVGIIGRNGSGKSTLLQMICGTLNPTSGRIQSNGRIAALLELGSGFNPEFTGLENIYMNARILGLSTQEVDEKLDEIKKFADIGEFVYQPVKTYSSGMFARLAFSVAVHVDPDVLIVDEALSVGDSWFQHKSMARMRSLMSSGCAVLFVSHSIDAIRALCDKAIWIEDGHIKLKGDTTSVTNEYMNSVFIEHNRIVLESEHKSPEGDLAIDDAVQPVSDQSEKAEDTELLRAIRRADGGAVLQVNAVNIYNSLGAVTDKLDQGEKFSLEFEIHFNRPLKNISIGFLIKDQFGQELTGESVFNTLRHSLCFEAGQTVRFVFSSSMMFRGGQSYSVALRINQVSKWDRSDNVTVFSDELAAVFDVLNDQDNPMWFKFKQPFEVAIFK